MIPAREAAEIANAAVLTKQEIQDIKLEIIRVASQGARSTNLVLPWLSYSRRGDAGSMDERAEKVVFNKSNKMKLAKDMLEAHGYKVNIKTQDPYVPKGLADDDGNGPMYCNVFLEVRW